MHKNILKIVELIEAPKQFIISGAILMGLFNLSLVPAPQELGSGLLELKHAGQYAEGAILESISIPKAQALVVDTPIAKIFFGEAGSSDTTHGLIEKQIGFVSSRKAYPASLSVIKKHERIIRSKAREYGVPEDVAIGVGLLENGGSDTAKSPAGALGVFQLMPGTARSLGLIVNGKVDERRNPEKNIDAGKS